MVLRNNNLNNDFKCSIFFIPAIPGLCTSVPRGWGTLEHSTMGYNFRSSAEIVHGVKSFMYWPCTQRHWWSLCRILNTSVEYLGSKRKVFEKRPSLPRFPLYILHIFFFVSDDDDSVAKKLLKKVRILVWVMTTGPNHAKKCYTLKKTWGRHCEKLLFMSDTQDKWVKWFWIYLFVKT